MILPRPPTAYYPASESDRNRQIEQADKQNHKRNQDIEAGVGRLILTSEGGNRYEVYVDDSGAILSRTVGGLDVAADPRIAQAERETLGNYGDTVSVAAKAKSLTKFGRNLDIDGAQEMLWNVGGFETYATGNTIDTVSSSSASDTGDVVIEGHTVVGTGDAAVYTFVKQTAVLNGQNKVTLATPLARASRHANVGSVSFTGDVYGYENTAIVAGVPTDDTKIHTKSLAGENQTFKASTTFSDSDYAFITRCWASVSKQQSAIADIQIQVRPAGGVFRPVFEFSVSQASGLAEFLCDPFIIVPRNADIRMVASTSTSNVYVNGGFQAYLAAVQ